LSKLDLPNRSLFDDACLQAITKLALTKLNLSGYRQVTPNGLLAIAQMMPR
jgi:hypothetical protein